MEGDAQSMRVFDAGSAEVSEEDDLVSVGRTKSSLVAKYVYFTRNVTIWQQQPLLRKK